MNVIETLNANADKTPDEIVEALKPKPREISFVIESGAISFDTIVTNTINTERLNAIMHRSVIEMRELSNVYNTRIEPSIGDVLRPRPDRERSIRSLGDTYYSTRSRF